MNTKVLAKVGWEERLIKELLDLLAPVRGPTKKEKEVAFELASKIILKQVDKKLSKAQLEQMVLIFAQMIVRLLYQAPAKATKKKKRKYKY